MIRSFPPSISRRILSLRNFNPHVCHLVQFRYIGTTGPRSSTTATATEALSAEAPTVTSMTKENDAPLFRREQKMPLRPLAPLPLTSLLRSLLLHTVSGSPLLLRVTTHFLEGKHMRYIDSPYNPLHWLLYHTFYRHFCAGRNQLEISQSVDEMRRLGMKGAILSYAREADINDHRDTQGHLMSANAEKEIADWIDGTKRTVQYSAPGDFVAVKFSGAGASVLELLGANPPKPPTPQLQKGLDEICSLAIERNVGLMVDAEHVFEQRGIDEWTLFMMRKYNKSSVRGTGRAVIYNTYQMYLKSSPTKLLRDIRLAAEEDWILGVKLVRGAYLHSEPPGTLCESKSETDRQYNDAIMELFKETRTRINLIIACHNRESIQLARHRMDQLLNEKRKRKGAGGVEDVMFSQLMGMADELSYGLVEEAKAAGKEEEVKVYKYVVWGTVQECVKYLLRRAQENQAAMERSKENVQACWDEIKLRIGLGGNTARK